MDAGIHIVPTNDGVTLLLCDGEQRKVPDSLMPYLERIGGDWAAIKRELNVRSFMEAFRGVDPECPWCHEILSPNAERGQCQFCLNHYRLVSTKKVRAVKCTSTSDPDTEKQLPPNENSTASSPAQLPVTLDH